MFICYTFVFIFSACFEYVISEWVEIPQFSNRKSYLGVTPFNSHFYDQSLYQFTPTTTESYESLLIPTLEHNHYHEPKKSITKFPDSYIKHMGLTTEMTRIALKHKQNNATKLNRKKGVIKDEKQKKKKAKTTTTTTTSTTTSTTTPKPIERIMINEKKYDDEMDVEDEEYYDDEYEDEEYVDDDDDDERHVHEGEIPMSDKEYYDDTEYEEEDYEDDSETSNDSAGHSYVGFLPYLKNIQSTLIRTSHKSTDDKVSFLSEIKNRLLYAIKQKIASLWPSSSRRTTRSTRHTRSEYSPWAKSDRGMDFPSNEGALLTLGFLTFAVFLIKCILRLIYSVKGKKHNHHHHWPYPYFTLPTLPTFTLPPSTAAMGRKRRSLDEKTVEIMDYIDTFKYK